MIHITRRIFEVRLLIEGAIVGILTGVFVSVFRCLLDFSDELRSVLYGKIFPVHPEYLLPWFAALILIGWLLYRISLIDPITAGSGIPQVKGILKGHLSINWLRVLMLKFVGAALGIGAGLSLGRQGPSVQFGACIGQGVSRLGWNSRPHETKYLITAGAGAGLAAAFNAPLAGVVFCIEELSRSFSSFQILSGMIAAVAAAATSQIFFGGEAVFKLGYLPHIQLGPNYIWFILLGIFCGFLGLCFNRGLLFALNYYDRLRFQGPLRYAIPLLMAGILGFILPDILGGGNTLVDQIIVREYGLFFLLVLLAGKFFFTLICFGSGAPGGIFLPMMALGALSGAIFGKIAIFAGFINPSLMQCCIVFGMAALFSGAVKSPISSTILIMELTSSFDHLLILLCISLSACMVLDMTKTTPIYEAILSRNQNHNMGK